jgi:uncharacterized protein (DUF58 family)
MWRLTYRLFFAIAGAVRWSERHLTPAGLLLLGSLVLAGVFGIDTTQSTAYRLFAFLTLLLAIALLGARARRGHFAAERLLPRVVTAGETFEYRMRLRNLAARPAQALRLQDEISDPRPAFEEFRAAGRAPGYGTWLALLERKRLARLAAMACPALAPGAVVELRLQGVALRRGRVSFTGISVGSTEALGLARGIAVIASAANLTILPRRYALPPFALPGGRRYQQGGVTLASSVGDSEEFIGLRDYRPGDPLTRLHWKSFARRGRPVVREYQDEYFERYALILDTFAAAGREAAFEDAVAVAASFACTIDTQDCLLDLMFVGAQAYSFTAGRGQLQGAGLLEVLAGVAPCVNRPFRDLADAVRARAAGLTGCVLILVGWDDARAELVNSLRARGTALRVLCIASANPDQLPPGVLALAPGNIQAGLVAL